MRSWRFHEFGDMANLKLEETPVPEPGEGEALVRLEYAALNPADRFLVMGVYPGAGTPPFAVGRDGCGTIETPCATGQFKQGDRVVVLRSSIGVSREGTLADYVIVPEGSLAPLPEGWTSQEGAAAPLVFLTAWQALVDKGAISAGKTVLITGASGGVGTAALLLAKAFDARVVALSRSEEKRARLKGLGADSVLDSLDPDLEDRAREVIGGGADIVIENLGGHFVQTAVNLCGREGRIQIIGLLTGQPAQINTGSLIFRRIRIQGIAVGAYSPEETQEAWAQIVQKLQSINARPIVDRTFGMNEVQEAFAHLAHGPMGKVLIDTGR